MRHLAAAALLCLPAMAAAAPAKDELCGGGSVVGDGVDAQVLVSKTGAAPARVTYVAMWRKSADLAYDLWVHYDPTEAGLGTPTSASVNAYMPVPDPERAEAEQMEWRTGSDPWVGPGYWIQPRRLGSDPKKIRGSIHHKIADSRTFPVMPELLAKFVPGARWEFRRLDRSGKTIGSGWVDYPPAPVIERLYARALAKAMADLEPCSEGPKMTASPAPPPMRIGPASAPPVPRTPAQLDADACRYLRYQEKLGSQQKAEPGQPVKVVAQRVDCTARSVTRVLEAKAIGKSERRELRSALQSLSDRTWCASPYFRILLKRGWALGFEIGTRSAPSTIGATTRACAEPAAGGP